MTKAIIGRWGKNLAIRVPKALAQAVELKDGEAVELELVNGDLLVRRSEGKARQVKAALAAAEAIEADRRGRTLGTATIRDLLEDDRRG